MSRPPVDHAPVRPMWICRADGQRWPCGNARLRFAHEAARDRLAVCVYLGTTLAEMIRDLHTLNPDTAPDPRELANRVLGCLPPRRQPPDACQPRAT